MGKPSIEDLARRMPHVLREFGEPGYTGSVDFYKDEIDVKGDGTLWAMAEYEVEFNWTHDPGDRVSTPPVTDFDVARVRVKDASFFDSQGNKVEIHPEQAAKVLVGYFWRAGLDRDEVLADQVQEQAGAAADYDRF